VGASQSCAVPVYHINTIVADSIQHAADLIEARVSKGADVTTAAREVAIELMKLHHPKIVFNGNNYSEEWVQEAARRGLPNLKAAPDALAVYTQQKNIDLFNRMGVLTPAELHARAHVLFELFLKRYHIEGQALATALNTQVLPAAVQYQGRLAQSFVSTRDALGAEHPSLASQKQLLEHISSLISKLQAETANLASVIHEDNKAHHSGKGELDRLREFHPKIVQALRSARLVSDQLEGLVDDDLWPIPKYSEILFLK